MQNEAASSTLCPRVISKPQRMVSMAVLPHLMMTFASRHREEFLELERQFASLEATPAIKRHQRSLDLRSHVQCDPEKS